jgi:hypothetical protein
MNVCLNIALLVFYLLYVIHLGAAFVGLHFPFFFLIFNLLLLIVAIFSW